MKTSILITAAVSKITMPTPTSPLRFLPGLPLSVYSWAIQQLFFHATGLALEYCDHSGTLRRYRVRPVNEKSYLGLLPRVLFNQCFILLPSMVIAEAIGLCFTGEISLNVGRFLCSLLVMAVGHDFVQYSTHRYLLHQSSVPLMRTLRHSVHHSTGATRGISACYMSAPDFFLTIVLPYLLPLAIVGGGGSDILFHTLVAGLGALGGVYEHSGYDFGTELRQPPPQGHDGKRSLWMVVSSVAAAALDNRAHSEHHIRANVSFSDGFGSPGICDWMFGTRWDLVSKRRRDAEVEWQAQQKAGKST